MSQQIQCHRCANYFLDDMTGAVHIAGCRAYNGWSNYESWLVALWIDNDPCSYTYWRDAAHHSFEDDHDAHEASAQRQAKLQKLARRLEDEHAETMNHRLGCAADVYTDLLRAAFSEVSWREIAEHLMAD